MTIRTSRLAGLAAALVATTLAGSAAAQSSANTNATGSMTLYQPIAITKNTDLQFGTLIRPGSGNGNVTIDATSGGINATGGIGVVTSSTHSRATFTVTGESGMNFTVTTPQSFNMTRSGGSDQIQVMLASSMGGGQLSGSPGTANFGVGGQILISNGTPSGAYSGTFTITVAYN